MFRATWKCATLVVIMLLSFGTNQVFAEDQNLGRVRIASFVYPRQVAPGTVFQVSLDIEYEVRTDVTIQGAIFEGEVNASNPVWQSDTTSVSGGGDKVWTIQLTAPATEGTLQLSVYAYYLENGVWKFYNDTILGPGVRGFSIKVARNANVQVELGVPGVELKLGNLSETTSQAGIAGFTIPVGTIYSLSVPYVLEYENSTRLIFIGWQDGSNQTNRVISIDEDTQLVGSYRTQYLLRVTSTLSNHSYQKWYDAKSNVTLQEVNSVPMTWPFDLLGAKYVFSGWSGDATSRSAEITFTMNSPMTVHAGFSIAYGILIVFPIIIALAVASELALLALKRKQTIRTNVHSPKSMPTCSKCGTVIEEGWVHCTHCGAKLDSLENGSKAGET